MNKKSQLPLEYMPYIVVALAFLLVIIAFIYLNLYPTTKEAARLTECKTSIQQHTTAIIAERIIPFIPGVNIPIKCPTKELTIKTDDETKIKATLAKEMAECWNIFGKGKLEFFKEKQGVFCAICSRIDFKDKNKKIKGLSDYLMKTKMPRSKLKYGEYLTGYETPNAKEYAENVLAKKGKDIPIDTSKVYSTLFVYSKGQDEISKLKEEVGGPEAATAIAFGIGYVRAGPAMGIIGGIITAIFVASAGEPPAWMAVTVLTEYKSTELAKYKCEYLPIEQS